MIQILALDVSTRQTGWALRYGENIIESGTVKATEDNVEIRKASMIKALVPIMARPLSYLMLERSFIAGSGDTTRLICELQGVIKYFAHRMQHRILEPSPTTWRAIVPGSGRADKQAAMEACRARGYQFETHDEAEAICMALSFGPKLLEILSQSRKEKKKNGKRQRKSEAGGTGGTRGRKARGNDQAEATPSEV